MFMFLNLQFNICITCVHTHEELFHIPLSNWPLATFFTKSSLYVVLIIHGIHVCAGFKRIILLHTELPGDLMNVIVLIVRMNMKYCSNMTTGL